MYRPPQLQLLVPSQIGGVSAAVNNTANALRDQMAALRGELALQNTAFYGGGRFVSSSAEVSGAPPLGGLRDGGGLTVELPASFGVSSLVVWMVQGAAFTLDELAGYVIGEDGGLVSLDNVPPGGSWYGFLSLSFDEETGYTLEAEWLPALDSSKRRSGMPCIGKVTTDADSVTAIDHAPADLIWSMAFLQAKIAALGASSGGGGGGGEGGSGPAFATQLPISDADATDTKSYIDEGLNGLQAIIERVSGAAEMFPAPFDILADEIALNRAGVGEVNPPAIERGEISVIGASFGKGQFDTPDFSPDTNDPLELPWDGSEGVFGP